jgi:hypothetical protein
MIVFVLLKLVMSLSEKSRYFWIKQKESSNEIEMTKLDDFNISSDSETNDDETKPNIEEI